MGRLQLMDTFTECPVCNGWYVSLEYHLKTWHLQWIHRKGYQGESMIESDLEHYDLYQVTFPKTHGGIKRPILEHPRTEYKEENWNE